MCSNFKTSLPLKMVLESFRFFLFWQLFIFTGGSYEVGLLPQQHIEYPELSPSEWRRSHSSAGPQRSILTFEGGVGPPARVLYPKFNLRPRWQSTPDLENEPIELAKNLHAAPFWWYRNKSLVAFCPKNSFCWPKTQFLGPKMAIFWLF